MDRFAGPLVQVPMAAEPALRRRGDKPTMIPARRILPVLFGLCLLSWVAFGAGQQVPVPEETRIRYRNRNLACSRAGRDRHRDPRGVLPVGRQVRPCSTASSTTVAGRTRWRSASSPPTGIRENFPSRDPRLHRVG